MQRQHVLRIEKEDARRMFQRVLGGNIITMMPITMMPITMARRQ